MQRRWTAAAVLALAALAGHARGAVEFFVLPLGQFGSYAGFNRLNDLGQVASSKSFDNPVGRFAIRTQPNAPFNPATDVLDGTREGYGINNLGQVVGEYVISGGPTHGFRTGPNQPFNAATDDIGDFGRTSYAYAINNVGQVTGDAGTAFRTRPNLPLGGPNDDLGTLGGTTSEGRDINDAGQVAGNSNMPGNQFQHAFRTGPNAAINPATDDLGTLGGDDSFASAVNNLGTVVGFSETLTGKNLPRHAFIVQPGQQVMQDLGTLGGLDSGAVDINDLGWIVGSANYIPGDHSQSHAFLFRDGAMIDLNTLIDPVASPTGLVVAYAINNLNQILAATPDQMYLLSPIPEPAGIVLGAIAFITFVYWTRRRPRRSAPLLYDGGASHGVASRLVESADRGQQCNRARGQTGGWVKSNRTTIAAYDWKLWKFERYFHLLSIWTISS